MEHDILSLTNSEVEYIILHELFNICEKNSIDMRLGDRWKYPNGVEAVNGIIMIDNESYETQNPHISKGSFKSMVNLRTVKLSFDFDSLNEALEKYILAFLNSTPMAEDETCTLFVHPVDTLVLNRYDLAFYEIGDTIAAPNNRFLNESLEDDLNGTVKIKIDEAWFEERQKISFKFGLSRGK